MTSTRGGSDAGKTITGAKCLMFFESGDHTTNHNSEKEIFLEKVVNKTLCSEKKEVTLLGEKDFDYQVRDSITKNFYGTKTGYPILEFTPLSLTESRGRDKHRAGIVMSRVFRLKKHRQKRDEGVGRETTYSFQETEGVVFAAHLKGSCWGEIPPPLPSPDQEGRQLEEQFSNPRISSHEDKAFRCVYNYESPSQLREFISKYQTSTFTR